MSLEQIIETTLYFLALLNPISKVLFLVAQKPAYSQKELATISIKSTLVSLLILLIITGVGNFLLVSIFHVEIYSLSVAGGIILFSIGLTAVRKESFLDEVSIGDRKLSDISIVPLAAPLIAGPGTITAAITFASMYGILVTNICIAVAVLINLLFMLSSSKISRLLEKLNATGPLIRITGLIVTAVAMQMIFSGCGIWLSKVI